MNPEKCRRLGLRCANIARSAVLQHSTKRESCEEISLSQIYSDAIFEQRSEGTHKSNMYVMAQPSRYHYRVIHYPHPLSSFACRYLLRVTRSDAECPQRPGRHPCNESSSPVVPCLRPLPLRNGSLSAWYTQRGGLVSSRIVALVMESTGMLGADLVVRSWSSTPWWCDARVRVVEVQRQNLFNLSS